LPSIPDLLLSVLTVPSGGAAAEEEQDALNATGRKSSSCHSFDLGGLDGEGRAVYAFAIGLGDGDVLV
jgi:hypothetical protein